MLDMKTDMRERPKLVTFLGQLLRHMQVATYIHVADEDRHKDKSWSHFWGNFWGNLGHMILDARGACGP